MSSPRTAPLVVVHFDKAGLSPSQGMHYEAYTLTYVKWSIEAALLTRTSRDAPNGVWLLDSRYSLLDGNLPPTPGPEYESTVTCFAVAPWSIDPPEQKRTTHHGARFTDHGGLFYVGPVALERIWSDVAYASNMFWAMLHMSPHQATKRRYPHKVKILTSKWDNHLTFRCLLAFTQAYAEYDPDVSVVYTPGSIRSAFEESISEDPDRPLLLLDADFVANGNPALMYELCGDENIYTHVFQVKNPINGLEYGHGGPKIVCPPHFDVTRDAGPDVTLSSTLRGMTVHPEVVGTHGFDYSSASVFKTTIREVWKLAQLADSGNEEAKHRLRVWKYTHDAPVPGDYALEYSIGAHLGTTIDLTSYINDFDFLHLLGQQNGLY